MATNIIIRLRNKDTGEFHYLSSEYRWTSNITLAWFMSEADLGQVFRVYDNMLGVGADDIELPFNHPTEPELVRINLTQEILSSLDVKRLRKRKVLESLSALDKDALQVTDEDDFSAPMSDDQ